MTHSCQADVNIQTHFQLEKHIVSKYEHKIERKILAKKSV